ncbi:galactokinase [Nocardioides sp. Y6]|uniref:Galactokinase n=1 Tax=Nocardioides malaquae TaxID=2773426 RepID=A0ABR9RSA4_9ACTN|nr:galactokinase family protein [Nocardioides malaquae]MBE7324423.1 galactokinase [Nocardioides malaquae]
MSPSVVPNPPPDLAQAAVDGLRRHHGVTATAVGRAPGRVNLIGEHTDYLGGLCLPIALAESTWVAVGPLPDAVPGAVRMSSGDDLRWNGWVDARSTGWEAYVLGALQAVGHRGGIALHVETTLPVGAGLSSSAALICAVQRAVSERPNPDLVDPAVAAEVEHVGVPTGGMDQSVALLATAGHALLLDFGTGARRAVPWRPEQAGLDLLVVDTGVRHDNAGGDFARRRAEATAALSDFGTPDDPVLARRRRHVLSENRRTAEAVRALERGDWDEVGELFIASHRSLRDDHEVSCPELDLVVSTSLAGGALGARMTGGGFGGCAIALCPQAATETVRRSLRGAFTARSWAVPTVWTAVASGAATRLLPGEGVTSWM